MIAESGIPIIEVRVCMNLDEARVIRHWLRQMIGSPTLAVRDFAEAVVDVLDNTGIL